MKMKTKTVEVSDARKLSGPAEAFDADGNLRVGFVRLASGEIIEADSAAPEDSNNLQEMLLPGGRLPLPPTHYKFGVCYAAAAFDGWVRQDSPCCAAASLVGAWNVVMKVHRDMIAPRPGQASALTREDGVAALRQLIESVIERKRSGFERMLGASIEPLVNDVVLRLAAEGKTLGGKGDAKTTKAAALRLVRVAVHAAILGQYRRGARTTTLPCCSVELALRRRRRPCSRRRRREVSETARPSVRMRTRRAMSIPVLPQVRK